MTITDCAEQITQFGGNMLAAQDSATRLAQARNLMERNGVIQAGLLRPAIAESWRRCLANGLNPRRAPKTDTLDEAALRRQRDQFAKVRNLAIPEMQALHQQLGAGRYVLAFAGPDGVLLDSLMAESLRAEIEGFGIVPGSIWTESISGTNALGTVSSISIIEYKSIPYKDA